jgi:hypothetical protein
MAENGISKLNISFEKSKVFKFIPATGAWGGPNPNGEIICNFFIEHRRHPKELNVEIESKTGKVKKEERKGESLIRELQVGIIMRPDIAKAVGEWLIKKADEVITTPEHIDKR